MPPSKKRKYKSVPLYQHHAINTAKIHRIIKEVRDNVYNTYVKNKFKQFDKELNPPLLPVEKKWKQQDKRKKEIFNQLNRKDKEEFLKRFGKYKESENSI